MRIGVLASQGAFIEHITILKRLNAETLPVRLPGEIAGLDGLIIPGGESTSISKLMKDYNLVNEINSLAQNGWPIFGTCAGMILLANNVSGSSVSSLGVMNIKVRRNAFGRQRDSFETELSIPVLGAKPFPAVFIRAPAIEQIGDKVEILAKLTDNTIVAVQQGRLLACAFHPELTNDLRFHQYFIDIINGIK